jgi:Asp-tRNA(Asn)/Glu-tRNA(Gln) amidotransferase C subunit
VADLTEAEVRALARALQLSLTAEDAAEVTHRLNAFLEALAPLAELDTEGVDAAPAPVDPDRA